MENRGEDNLRSYLRKEPKSKFIGHTDCPVLGMEKAPNR